MSRTPSAMDPANTGVILKHLEKQGSILAECQKSMMQELQKLQVEEEMLMRKLYEVVSDHNRIKKIEGSNNFSKSLIEGCDATINSVNEEQQQAPFSSVLLTGTCFSFLS